MSSKAVAKLQYRLSWERVFGVQGSRGQVYLLPSEAQKTIVQYEPDFRITCLIGPKTRNVVVESGRQDFAKQVTSPWLLLSQILYLTKGVDTYAALVEQGIDPGCDCERCRTARDLLNEALSSNHGLFCNCEVCGQPSIKKQRIKVLYHLFALDISREDEIVAQPYRLSNIYEDGKICFKKNASAMYYPQNMRQAHSSYWTHKFDNDFNWAVPHECTAKMHSFRHCNSRRLKNHKCEVSWHHKHLCLVDVEQRKKCPCCLLICACAKSCACCERKCNCTSDWLKKCNCYCCMNTCKCACACNQSKIFAGYVGTYTPKPELWEVYTSFICGNKFISTPKAITGVFISHDETLLADVPAKLHCSGRGTSSKPTIIGFATLKPDGWYIDLGELEFSLGHNQVSCVE